MSWENAIRHHRKFRAHAAYQQYLIDYHKQRVIENELYQKANVSVQLRSFGWTRIKIFRKESVHL